MTLKTCKMATFILLKLLTLEWDISRTIWRIEVSDGSFLAIFTLFHLSLTFFRTEFPLTLYGHSFKLGIYCVLSGIVSLTSHCPFIV